MPNWFDRKYNDRGSSGRVWLFSVEAAVAVPETGEEEKDKDTAQNVLQTVLGKAEGDASLHTAIDSNVQFQIQFEPIQR